MEYITADKNLKCKDVAKATGKCIKNKEALIKHIGEII